MKYIICLLIILFCVGCTIPTENQSNQFGDIKSIKVEENSDFIVLYSFKSPFVNTSYEVLKIISTNSCFITIRSYDSGAAMLPTDCPEF